MGHQKTKYRINEDTCPLGGVGAITAAHATWNSSAWQGNGGGDFRFICEGDTQRYADKQDNRNTVAFQGHKLHLSNPPAARTFIRQTNLLRPDRLKEVDTIINTKYYWATGVQANHYDIQSVMTHEFGHWLAAEHLWNGESEEGGCDEFTSCVMYHTLAKATIKRDLHWIDKWAKWYIYTSEDVPMAPQALLETIPPPLQHARNILQTRLLQNYPDPFNPETWIPYEIAKDCSVAITIYDTTGNHVRKLDLGHHAKGRYLTKNKAAYWDGKNDHGQSVASGLYFYTLEANGVSDTRRLAIVK